MPTKVEAHGVTTLVAQDIERRKRNPRVHCPSLMDNVEKCMYEKVRCLHITPNIKAEQNLLVDHSQESEEGDKMDEEERVQMRIKNKRKKQKSRCIIEGVL